MGLFNNCVGTPSKTDYFFLLDISIWSMGRKITTCASSNEEGKKKKNEMSGSFITMYLLCSHKSEIGQCCTEIRLDVMFRETIIISWIFSIEKITVWSFRKETLFTKFVQQSVAKRKKDFNSWKNIQLIP